MDGSPLGSSFGCGLEHVGGYQDIACCCVVKLLPNRHNASLFPCYSLAASGTKCALHTTHNAQIVRCSAPHTMWIDEALPPVIVKQLADILAEADAAYDEQRFGDAIEHYRRAFKLLPAPPHQWVTASWLLIVLGDAAFRLGNSGMADEALRELVREGRGWETSALCWLRRGQIALDRGDEKRAADCLASAFMLAGYDIFSTEDEKYARFVLGQLDSPIPPVDHPLARFHRDRVHGAQPPSEKPPWWKFW